MTANHQTEIDRLVEELVNLEPELGGQKAQLHELVARLLAAKPDAQIDRQFVERLRRELLTEKSGSLLAANPIANLNQFMIKLKYIIGGSAVLAAVVLVAVFGIYPRQSTPASNKLADLISSPSLFESGIVPLQPNAFGSLAVLSNIVPQQNSAESLSAEDKGFGGGGRSAISSQPLTAVEAGAIMVPSDEYVPVNFKYTAEPLAMLPDQLSVYRRTKEVPIAAISSAVAAQRNGLVNLSGLTELNVNSLSMKHKSGSDEYWVHLDLLQGMASINLEYGPRGYNSAPGQELPDEQLIDLANSFLDRYGIDRSAYAEPKVDQSWRLSYATAETREAPSFVQVDYQLLVNEQPIVSWGKRPFGLQVMIDTGNRRVQSAVNIMTQRFESSAYTLEIDTAKLLAYAEAGGLNGRFWLPKGSVTELQLGQPTISYYQHYIYDERSGSQELFVPTLFFPVLNYPAEQSSEPQFVMVPLVKEILDAQQRDDIGVPEPMPFIQSRGDDKAIEIVAPSAGESVKVRIE
ncbi:MAG: hypothetical protein V1738_00760 [Patescibacteria group bacterium]